MKFVIRSRGFIVPVIAGLILLFQNWIPHAIVICVILNLLGLLLISIDYFMMPETDAFNFERVLPPHFFIHDNEEIIIRISYDIQLPITLEIIDHPPEYFSFEPKLFKKQVSGGHGIIEFSYNIKPLKRGEHSFRTAGLRISSPLGLISRQTEIKKTDTVIVYPRLQDEKEGLQSQFYLSQTENRQIKMYGPGREFSQMREYVHGDDIKNIHWKRSSRCGKLIVKEYEPEKGQNIFIMLDGGRLMMAETMGLSKVDWAVASAISLAREALFKNDSVGVMGFSNKVDTFLMPSNKNVQLSTLVKTIYAFQPDFIEPDYKTSFEWVHANIKNRSIIVVYTDFIDPYLSSELATHIKLLKRKHRVICCAMGFEQLYNEGYKLNHNIKNALFSSLVRDSIYSRKKILTELTRAGVDVIDVFPEKLCAEVLNSYIRIRWS